MLGTRDHLFLNKLIEQLAEIIIKTIEIGLFFRGDDRFAVVVLRREHGGQFRICSS